MSYELLNSIATVGTFVVISATAVAAMIQLRHLRSNNELQAMLDLGREFQQVAPHISFVYGDLPTKMKDPQFRKEVGINIDPAVHPELIVAAFFDQCGLLIRLRLMPEKFIMEYAGGADSILRCWHNLSEVIAIRRSEAPTVYRNFELLAVHARKWLARYPRGSFTVDG
jgi:hypothetical protein